MIDITVPVNNNNNGSSDFEDLIELLKSVSAGFAGGQN